MKITLNIYDIDKKKDFIFDHEQNLATPYEGYETDLDGLKHLLAHKELRVFDATTNTLITEKGLDKFLAERSAQSTQTSVRGKISETLSAGNIGDDPVTIVEGEGDDATETEYKPVDGDIFIDGGNNVILAYGGKYYKIG